MPHVSSSPASAMPPAPPAGPARGVRIAGTGMCLPPRVLSNQDLTKMVDTTEEWILQRTGIRERRIVGNGVSTRQLGRDALKQALERAGMDPKALDFVIVATLTPEMVFPATAARIVSELGATPAGGMDLSAACSGFVYALNVASALIQSGQHKTVGVVGAETMSQVVNWKDRGTCILLGDGAGAAVLTVSDDPRQGCLFSRMASDGAHWKDLYCPRTKADIPPDDKVFNGEFNTLQMNGREIFKFAVHTLQDLIDETLAKSGLTPADLAMVIPHQSNIRIIDSAREKMGLPAEKMYVNIDRYGNTSAASVPICLHELTESGRIKRGDAVLFIALGAGLTWASSLWRL